ncbi:MAG: AAA family ATPase [Pseudomonadota bacterium]
MRKVVLTGCSGGGKSTLLAALGAEGHATVAEPGRRVIAAERLNGMNGLPWADVRRFSDLAFWMAVGDHATADADLTFFDRSALDQAAWYAREGLSPPGEVPVYDPVVLLAPPWPEIFVQDDDRRHGWDDAVAEYTDLATRLPEWGYRCYELPRCSVVDRVIFVRDTLAKAPV